MGGSKPKPQKQNIYYEDGMHIIGYGRMYKIHNIYENGKKLLDSPINRSSHPSGSAVSLGAVGTVYVYWGENDQPECTLLTSQTGLRTTYPNVAYVFWKKKKLGTSPNWAQLEYDVDFQALDTDLTPHTYNNTIYDARTIRYSHAQQYHDYITLDSGTLNKGDIVTDSVTGAIFTIINVDSGKYYIDIFLPFTASNREAQAKNVTQRGVDFTDAVNHLFKTPFPLGLNLQDDVIEDCAVTGDGVVNHTRIHLADGKTYSDGIKGIMEDNGMLLYLDTLTGIYRYKLLREDTEEPLVLSLSEYEPIDEASVTARETNKADRVVWEYTDLNRNFEPSTIPAGNSPIASPNVSLQQAKAQLNTVTDVKTASEVVTRRTQERSVSSSYAIKISGAYAYLPIGKKITLEGDPSGKNYIIYDKTYDPNTASMKVNLLDDIYSVGQYVAYDENIKNNNNNIYPYPDSSLLIVEPNRFVTPDIEGLYVARARSRNTISGSNIHISTTGTTYENVGSQASVGGFELLEDVGTGYINDILITSRGSDLLSHVTDLSSDPALYYAGGQVAYVGREIMYVESVEVVSADTYRLKNVLRGRLGTKIEDLTTGDVGCIDIQNSLTLNTLPTIVNGVTTYVKSTPYTSLQTLELSDVTAISSEYKGGGKRPAPPTEAYKTDYTRTFIVTDDLDLEWYGANAKGTSVAGIINTGVATTESTVEGTYLLVIRNSSSSVKEIKELSVSNYNLTNSEIVSIFGSVPTEIFIDVAHVLEGVTSELKTTRFERI